MSTEVRIKDTILPAPSAFALMTKITYSTFGEHSLLKIEAWTLIQHQGEVYKKWDDIPQPLSKNHRKQSLKHGSKLDIVLRFIQLAFSAFSASAFVMAVTGFATRVRCQSKKSSEVGEPAKRLMHKFL